MNQIEQVETVDSELPSRVGLYVRPISRAGLNEFAARLSKLHNGAHFSQSDAIDWLLEVGQREIERMAVRQ